MNIDNEIQQFMEKSPYTKLYSNFLQLKIHQESGISLKVWTKKMSASVGLRMELRSLLSVKKVSCKEPLIRGH